MTEYRIGKAIVRMHGQPDREELEKATAEFLSKVLQHRRKLEKERREADAQRQTDLRGM